MKITNFKIFGIDSPYEDHSQILFSNDYDDQVGMIEDDEMDFRDARANKESRTMTFADQ